MTSLSMLTMFNAVPFQFPEQDRSIAARRMRSRQLRETMERPEVAAQVNQHLLMTTVVNEAVDAFQSVLDPRLPATPTAPGKLISPLQPHQPPNSPDNVRTTTTFDFEAIFNEDDGLPEVAAVPMPEVDELINNPDATVSVAPSAGAQRDPRDLSRNRRGRRSQRKRRRVPSFKTKQSPRVPAKLQLSSEEADDEASSDDDISRQKAEAQLAGGLLCPNVVSIQQLAKDVEYSSLDDDEDYVKKPLALAARRSIFEEEDSGSELQLKLQVLSEAQKTVRQAEEKLLATDWAKVGAELRCIADHFSETSSSSDDDAVDGVMSGRATANGLDFVAFVNTMLPFSVPQSLWSALVSYAAWKIFKQFQ